MGLKESGLRGSLRNVSVGIDAIPDSVVSRWQFNDDSDTSIAIDSEGANDGDITGATYTTNAIEGSHALEYTDGTDEVSLGNITDSEDAIGTIGCWVNADSFSADDIIFETNGYRFGIGHERVGSNGIEGRAFDGSSSVEVTSGVSTTNDWLHTALTWNGSEIELYIDGSSQGTASISSIEITTANDMIGQSDSEDERAIDGRIDDAFYSDVAMGESEINDMISLAD